MGQRNRGLYNKFSRIERADGSSSPGEKHADCEYFVLDLTHDPHAVPAIRAYADSAEKDGYRELANDLRTQAHAIEYGRSDTVQSDVNDDL